MTEVFKTKENNNGAVHDTDENLCSRWCLHYMRIFVCAVRKDNWWDWYNSQFYQNKLKLNSEKVDCIRKVTEKSDLDLEGSNAGVCRKCFRSVESIIKADEKNKAAKQRLIQSLDQVCKTQFLVIPSPRRKAITKRMLRSPHGPDQPSSRRANPLARVAYV